MRVGESFVEFNVDSLAGTPGMIPSLTGAMCTLIVVQKTSNINVQFERSRVTVPSSRVVPNSDGRTFTYTAIASDVPSAGVYELQLVCNLLDGRTIRLSEVGTIVVEESL